tara:strand:- start:182 stop:358 length:177 start_codon:yes stop_codon:yes gene_type:complete
MVSVAEGASANGTKRRASAATGRACTAGAAEESSNTNRASRDNDQRHASAAGSTSAEA